MSKTPISTSLSKVETGVTSFLRKYPNYNGSDVVIAVFDSGVDPLAAGLETLCDGKTVKVIERFDCTGAGDVNCSKKVFADENGIITGLSGRKLKVTKDMLENNVSKTEFRIGLKCVSDLMPLQVSQQFLNMQKQNKFEEPNKKAIADMLCKITSFEAENPETMKLSWERKLIKHNMDTLLELLNYYDQIYNSVEPSYDCVLYNTLNGWQTVIDTTENGDLENALFIGEYSKTNEIKNIDHYIYLSVNVHDDGDILEIVSMSCSHGTHVSYIASASNGSIEHDGVAPNASIVSLTISDMRLNAMTGCALVRAMIVVMNMCKAGRKVDIINMSFSDFSCCSNNGRIAELMSEVVNKYGVVWVVSAGNCGPTLSSVGTPPDILEANLIGVGACVGQEMTEAEYSICEHLPGSIFYWSSRDPCMDGGLGITVCAPGQAIASVPRYTMSKSMLMEGTSMAAPYVSGAVALIISGLKQAGIDYSPYSIKRALAVTASKLKEDSFGQGNGLLNVLKTFEHLVTYARTKEVLLRFSISVGTDKAKGIYIRSGQLKSILAYNVYIQPFFLNDSDVAPEKKFNFNMRLSLACSYTFVQCDKYLDLSYHVRNYVVKINGQGLEPGVHVANIRAYDLDCVQKGVLFEIPIVIIQPFVINAEICPLFEAVSQRRDGTIEFFNRMKHTSFILVPNGATWVVLRMRLQSRDVETSSAEFLIHTMQLLPKEYPFKLTKTGTLKAHADSDAIMSFNVQSNNIMELSIFNLLSNGSNVFVKYCLEFHGLQLLNANVLSMHAPLSVHKLEIAALATESINPKTKLKNAAVVLKPIKNKITPLSATRDMLPDGRQIYQNVLTFDLLISEDRNVCFYVPLLDLYMFESPFESQVLLIYKDKRKWLNSWDCRSKEFFLFISKGEYIVILQVRHEKLSLLELVNDAKLVVLFELKHELHLELYEHRSNVIVNKSPFRSGTIKRDSSLVLYIGALSQKCLSQADLPPNTSWLSGYITLTEDEICNGYEGHKFIYDLHAGTENLSNKTDAKYKAIDGQHCNWNTLESNKSAVSIPDILPAITEPTGNGISNVGHVMAQEKRENISFSEYLKLICNFKCNIMQKLDLESTEKLYQEIIATNPQCLEANMQLIRKLQLADVSTNYPFAFTKAAKGQDIIKLCATQDRIIRFAAIVIENIDKEALLAYFGLKYDTRSDAYEIREYMAKQKEMLVDAFAYKGISVVKQAILKHTLKEQLPYFDDILKEILKYVDETDSKVILFSLWHAYAHEQFGRMHSYLQTQYQYKPCPEIIQETAAALNAQGYTHLVNLIERFEINNFSQIHHYL